NSQHKIRLAGIDAPEHGQPFSNRSKQNLYDLVFGKEVIVEYNKTDRYGRLVGKGLVDGHDANFEQIKPGLAWVYRKYEGDLSSADRKAYDEAEKSARAAKRGLWSDPAPQPPWEFRHPESVPAPGAASSRTGMVIGNKRSGIYHLPECPDYYKVGANNREYFA